MPRFSLDLPALDDELVVEYYPYRTARVIGSGVREYSLDDATWRRVKSELNDRVNAMDDNHVVYGLIGPEGVTMYLWYHDLHVFVGTRVEVDIPGKSVLSV